MSVKGWSGGDVARLVEHAEEQIAAVTAHLWPNTDAVFGPTVTAGGALARQVRVGDDTLCAKVRPAGVALSAVVRGEHGDLTAVLAHDTAGKQAGLTIREADHLKALAAYSSLPVATPISLTGGVLFAPWVTGPSLADRVQENPTYLTFLLRELMDNLYELHCDPPNPLRQLAARPALRALPRVLDEASWRRQDHLRFVHTSDDEAREARALLASLSVRLRRLASRLDPLLFAHSGVAFGNLSPAHVLHPDTSPRATVLAPALDRGGRPVDCGSLLGHLHLLIITCPQSTRAELVDGVERWLDGHLGATSQEQWRGWLAVVMTIWAATVYEQVVTALTLPKDSLPLDPATAGLRAQPLPALAVLDVLTRGLRRRGTETALIATLAALASNPT